MGATLGEGKQVLALLLEKDPSRERMEYLLGGPLADLLDRDARPESCLDREMLRGLIGLPFRHTDGNIIRVFKTDTGFEARWLNRKDVCGEGETPQEAVGNLISTFPWFFGIGLVWGNKGDDPENVRTQSYASRANKAHHITVIEVEDTSSINDKSGRYGPFSSKASAEKKLKEKGWSYSDFNGKKQWNCRTGRVTSATAKIRGFLFADAETLDDPRGIPCYWK